MNHSIGLTYEMTKLYEVLIVIKEGLKLPPPLVVTIQPI